MKGQNPMENQKTTDVGESSKPIHIHR